MATLFIHKVVGSNPVREILLSLHFVNDLDLYWELVFMASEKKPDPERGQIIGILNYGSDYGYFTAEQLYGTDSSILVQRSNGSEYEINRDMLLKRKEDRRSERVLIKKKRKAVSAVWTGTQSTSFFKPTDCMMLPLFVIFVMTLLIAAGALIADNYPNPTTVGALMAALDEAKIENRVLSDKLAAATAYNAAQFTNSDPGTMDTTNFVYLHLLRFLDDWWLVIFYFLFQFLVLKMWLMS